MNNTDIISLIANVGFPIFVSLWFMFRLEKKINKVIELLGEIRDNAKEKEV